MTPPILWCGSAGLARALAGPARREAFAPAAPLLMLIGSDHPVSRAQRDALSALIAPLRATDRSDIANAVARVADLIRRGSTAGLALDLPAASAETAKEILATTCELIALRMPRPGSVFVTGGETLFGLLQALRATSLLATGELMPGVAHARIGGGCWHGLPVVAKSGGFGGPDLLIDLAESVMP